MDKTNYKTPLCQVIRLELEQNFLSGESTSASTKDIDYERI